MKFRIGSSFDIHQCDKSRPLILGGVQIAKQNGLMGHSDADVLTHVITEAIIGALGLGDLGQHFPDTSVKFKDINSTVLLLNAIELMEQQNFKIGNIDTQIILDSPKLSEFNNTIKINLCSILKIDQTQLNIKATRCEHSITAIENNAAIFAFATILLEENNE